MLAPETAVSGPQAETDAVDLTNIAIQVDDWQAEQLNRVAPCSGVLSTIAGSSVVRYAVTALLAGLLVFLIERLLGPTAVSDQLRSLLGDILNSESLQIVASSAKPPSKRSQ